MKMLIAAVLLFSTFISQTAEARAKHAHHHSRSHKHGTPKHLEKNR